MAARWRPRAAAGILALEAMDRSEGAVDQLRLEREALDGVGRARRLVGALVPLASAARRRERGHGHHDDD